MSLELVDTTVTRTMAYRVERTDMIPSRRKSGEASKISTVPIVSKISTISRTLGIVSIVAALTLSAAVVEAQQTTGRITGRVTDMGTGQPLVGITVILQGQQGEDAALTDDHGDYTFVNLAVGTYVVRFYNANSSTKVERADLTVSAGATLRADAAIPSQAAVEETYVIKKRAAAVDVGSTRIGMTVDEDYMKNVPLDLTFGDLVLKAPGAFLESSGGVSIAGASGLENVYVMNGMNVTGMEFGDIMNKTPNASGGSNLTLDFIKELQVTTGGYNAEFGGAMGGVVNVMTKSGSNDYHGSAFMYWSPYWMSANPQLVLKTKSALVGVDKPDYDTNIGFEVGGPIIKNKLFFWVGFAPRREKSHFFRDVQALVDADQDGVQDLDPKTGQPVTNFIVRTRSREFRQSYQYGVKIDYLPAPDHKLTVGLYQTPSESQHVRSPFALGQEANADPRFAMQDLHKDNTDVTANWVSQLLDRRLRLDASVGLHREVMNDESPYGDLNGKYNQMEWHGASLFNLEPNLPGIGGCAPISNGSYYWDPCPVDNYHNGGYGEVKSFTGNRWMADLKSTYLINHMEIKAGAHLEYNTFDQTRYYSGVPGTRNLIQNFQDQHGGTFNTAVYNLFTLRQGQYPFQFQDMPEQLTTAPYYQDSLVANVKSVNTAYFIQDSIHPIPNLTIDGGLRYENQTMYDFRGNEFISLDNYGPRAGVVFDPSNEGRSKIFAHYGRAFESIPMNLAARYFGGEGIAVRAYDSATCSTPPTQWTGTGGEWNKYGCQLQPATNPYGVAPVGIYNAGSTYPVQPKIKGQYHDEIVAGFHHALTDDLVVGADYTHRWLGGVIEDGTASGDFGFVLANVGDVPPEVLTGLKNDITAKNAQIAAATDPTDKAIKQNELGALQSKLDNLTGLAHEPKPKRTYDALTLSAAKRMSRNWMMQASYTYSRLIGNYNGLYDSDNSYFAPNGNNYADTPELVLNRTGPLANDRPHAGRVDGYYQIPVGNGSVLLGLSFSAYSGVPRNYVSQWVQGIQLNFLLPRGSAGRTPTVTQADAKIAYHHELSKTTAVEAFVDLYNLFNDRTALQVDDNYTFDLATPIVNGTVNDLKYAKNIIGMPIAVNPNFGRGTVFQQPFHGRLGVRFLF